MSKKHLVKLNWLVIFLLLLGVFYKLLVTGNYDILFHIDSARDYVDVREMVELLKPRLIGQTSAIDGFYTGPGWYYLLIIPYIFFAGDPYGGVILMIALWGIGGYFLYLITRKYGMLAWLTALLLWFASPYIGLATVYSFNPHPVLFLTPLFVFLLEKYIASEKIRYGLGTAFLGALFFQWEMNTGVFMPIIILFTILLVKKLYLLKSKGFWLSVILYSSSLLPQAIFDLRHEFLMSKAMIRYLSEGGAGAKAFGERIQEINDVFLNAFNPILLNSPVFVKSILILLAVISLLHLTFKFKNFFKEVDLTFVILVLSVLVPYVGYILLPVNVHSWHMVSIAAAMIGLVAFIIGRLTLNFPTGWGITAFIFLFCITTAFQTIKSGVSELKNPSLDPSTLANEMRAIDFAYEKVNGQNFRAYTYVPSVIDFPYQYLYWWYGLKKYGYTPSDYAYLPNKPEYLSNKAAFVKPKVGEPDSGLIVLIKDHDRLKTRHLWENNFAQYQLLDRQMVGPLEVEIRTSTDSAVFNPML